MPAQKGKVDNIHDQMPAIYDTRNNVNWKALIEAIGGQDQDTIDLIEAVRQQFFIKTATRPHIDRLGTANLVQRPRFVGMDDPTFRQFIPIMSYNPKQVKLVLDKLLDLFFFKESTTSFVVSDLASPFNLQDGWELEYSVDDFTTERIEFNAVDFTDITNATANEVVAAINRQVSNSYAIAFEDSITKEVNIQIFTETIGSKGSIEITGGAANIGFEFEGFNTLAGQGGNSEWTVTKVGDLATMTYTGVGNSPSINQVQPGDIVIITRSGNDGSFVIESVDSANDMFTYKNLFATPETFTQSLTDDVKFMTPFKARVHLKDRRAVIWEVSAGEVIVELPPSPPVVKRNRKGAAHINGIDTTVLSVVDANTLQLNVFEDFPLTGGQFFFIPLNEIQTYFPLDSDTSSFQFNSKLSSDLPIYTYTTRVGNQLNGITPDLPSVSGVSSFALTSADRDNSNLLTVTTAVPHDVVVGEYAIIDSAVQGGVGGLSTNGTWLVTDVISPTVFECYSFSGPAGAETSTGGTIRVERAGIAAVGGRVILRSAQLDEKKIGPFLWDENADFVLSSLTANLTAEIEAGSTQRNIQVTPNEIPAEEGRLIFDFGTEKQEGPVRYFHKPSDSTLALDPSYVFEFTHDVGSSVTMIRRRGGIQFDGFGSEHAPYITDPAAAREVLQELMQELKSVGIFINFLIRFPEFFYATIDVYKSGEDPG
jgi:hypothetical protein